MVLIDYQTEEHSTEGSRPSIDIRSRIDVMGMLFIKDGLVDPAIISVDSSLLKAKGHVWHRSNMKKNEVPRSGIDTDAR